jgi:hypothetical protein
MRCTCAALGFGFGSFDPELTTVTDGRVAQSVRLAARNLATSCSRGALEIDRFEYMHQRLADQLWPNIECLITGHASSSHAEIFS